MSAVDPKPDTVVVNAPEASTVSVDAREDLQEIISTVPAVISETKKGYKTTEFWVAVGLSLATQFDVTNLPEKWQGIAISVIGAAYILSRGIAKKGVPAVEPVDAPGA